MYKLIQLFFFANFELKMLTNICVGSLFMLITDRISNSQELNIWFWSHTAIEIQLACVI